MIYVSCAIIIHQNRILICQRSESMSLPLKWEFPGGKVESNESPVHCIIREIQEELNIEIKVHQQLTTIYYSYPDFSLSLIPFICTTTNSNYVLKEHKDAIWCCIEEIENLDLAEADIPIIDELRSLWNSGFMKLLLLKK